MSRVNEPCPCINLIHVKHLHMQMSAKKGSLNNFKNRKAEHMARDTSKLLFSLSPVILIHPHLLSLLPFTVSFHLLCFNIYPNIIFQ